MDMKLIALKCGTSVLGRNFFAASESFDAAGDVIFFDMH